MVTRKKFERRVSCQGCPAFEKTRLRMRLSTYSLVIIVSVIAVCSYLSESTREFGECLYLIRQAGQVNEILIDQGEML